MSRKTKETLLEFSSGLFPEVDRVVFALDEDKVLVRPDKDLFDGRGMAGEDVGATEGRERDQTD